MKTDIGDGLADCDRDFISGKKHIKTPIGLVVKTSLN